MDNHTKHNAHIAASSSLLSIILALVAGGLIVWFLGYKGYIKLGSKPAGAARGFELKLAQHRLWTDHVVWTRQFIVSTLAKLEDAKPALERLLKNQDDLGNAIEPFYGREAGRKLAELLREHIVIAGDVVAAAAANNKQKLDASQAQWHKNAEDIADFLSSANPENWPKEDLVHMLNMHLDLTTQEAVFRLKKDWQSDIANFDKILTQALEMADALTDGICAQFPDKCN